MAEKKKSDKKVKKIERLNILNNNVEDKKLNEKKTKDKKD
jgi:hypothetical protein